MWTLLRAWLLGQKKMPSQADLQTNRFAGCVDDCVKFVQREQRRGNTYDGIIMDPPSYGRGPGGEVWKLEEQLYHLVELCLPILSETTFIFYIKFLYDGVIPCCYGISSWSYVKETVWRYRIVKRNRIARNLFRFCTSLRFYRNLAIQIIIAYTKGNHMDYLQTQDVRFSYDEDESGIVEVLKGVTLGIQKGDFVSLLGHNGSGKSTLAKHFNAILLPSGGKVYVDTMDTTDDSLQI